MTLVGYGKSSLDQVAEVVAAQQGRVVEPDQFPDAATYYRSDQFIFAKVGVPAIYFSDGTDFIGRPAGWGRQQDRGLGAEAQLPPAERPSWMERGTSTA